VIPVPQRTALIHLPKSPQPALPHPLRPQTGKAPNQRPSSGASKLQKIRKEAEAVTKELCAKHQQRLTQMEPARRVFYTNEKGESVRMDDNQRMELIKEDKEFIAKNCK